MSNTVLCVYRANAYNRTPAQLALAIRAQSVPLDPMLISLLGVTVASDATLSDATHAERGIVLNLTPAFKAMFPDATDQRSPFWNFMTGLIQASALTPIVADAPLLA
jgi:hypothetical protein